jgi:RNA polymerase sigma-70 factor (ECF subfamily)
MDPLDVKDEHSTVGLNPAEVLEKENQSSRLQEALMRLPNHQRIPLVLFHFDELSYEEIAKALNISLSKIKTDIHRGRAALATVLDPVQMGVV